MDLVWFEKNLIIALRILLPFFRKYKFHLCALDIDSLDGDYLVFCSLFNKTKISVILNPGFDILIERNLNFFQSKISKPVLSLNKEKKKSPKFSDLNDNFKNDVELDKLLKEYIIFLENDFNNYLVNE